MAPEPYKISVPQEKIENLKKKLALAEFPDELSEAAWDLGVPLADMKRLTKAWAQWDWRQAEDQLNRELPQYHTSITVDGFDPLDVHFVWQKSDVKNAIPLLFAHGCKCYASLAMRFAKYSQGLVPSLKFNTSCLFFPSLTALHSILLLRPCQTLASVKVPRSAALQQNNTLRLATS